MFFLDTNTLRGQEIEALIYDDFGLAVGVVLLVLLVAIIISNLKD